MKMKQTENSIMLYILQKQNYRRFKEKFRKIRNICRKKRSCWHNIFKGDDVYWGNIRQGLLLDDTSKCQNIPHVKSGFEAFVAELRQYVSPNPLSPYYSLFLILHRLVSIEI